MSYAYRCGPTATISTRTSWAGVGSPNVNPKYERPLSGTYDRIFNAFERSNAFEYVKSTVEKDERHTGHGDIIVNRKPTGLTSADCSLAGQSPCSEDEEFYREKILYSQARQLYPLQEDLADWINKTIGISYLTGENFLDVLDNGVELCQLAAVIHDRGKAALDQGLIVGVVPCIRGRCWQRAARRSFFSRDNTENFITFCRELGVHENLLFESDDLVLHNQPRQVILCLLELARLTTRFGVEPPGLVQLEREIALEERDCTDGAPATPWQFREQGTGVDKTTSTDPPVDEEDNTVNTADREDAESTVSADTNHSGDSDVPLRPTNELDKRVQLVTRLMERGCNCGAGRCSKLLKVKKVGEGRYNIAGRNVFIRLLKGRHMMVRVGGGWDTLEHFLSRHEPCQVRLVTATRRQDISVSLAPTVSSPTPSNTSTPSNPRRPSATPVPSPNNSSPTPIRTSPTPNSRASSNSSPPPSNLRRSSTTTPSPANSSRATTPTPKTPNRASLTLPLNSQARKKATPSRENIRILTTPPIEHANTTIATPKRRIPTPIKDKVTPITPKREQPRKVRSQSVTTTPVENKSFCGTDRLNEFAKKTRSMSLATPLGFKPINKPMNKSISVTGPMTQAAIEESIRLSLAASIEDNSTNKPFLHIKAKYKRPPPPREVPPR